MDLAYGALNPTPERQLVVDFSYPYDMSAWGILSKKPNPFPKYSALLGPFSQMVWIMIILTYAATVFTYWGLGRLGHGRGESFSQAFFKTMMCMFLQGRYVYVFPHLKMKLVTDFQDFQSGLK